MWDFTYMCNPIISSSRVSLPLYRFQDLSVGHELVLLTPPCLMGFFTSSTHHPWVSHTSSMRTTCQLRTHIHENPNVHVHENLASHHYLAPLAIFLLFVFVFVFCFFLFFYFFVLGSLCVGRLRLSLSPLEGTMNTSPPSPPTTMGSNTTCRGDNTLGSFLE